MPVVHVARRATVAKVAETVATRLHGTPKPAKSVGSKNLAEVAPTIADRRQEQQQHLQIGVKTSVATMKGVVAHCLRRDKRCILDVVGLGAISQALESVIRAEDFLEDDRRPVTTPEVRNRPGNLPQTRLHVQLLPPWPTVAGSRLRLTSGTKPRDLGKAIVAGVRKGDFPNISGAGPKSIQVAFEAFVIAQTLLHRSVDMDDRRLAFAVRREVELGRTGKEFDLTCFTCVMAPRPIEMRIISRPDGR